MKTLLPAADETRRAAVSQCAGCGYPSFEVICPLCKADRRWFGEIFYRVNERRELVEAEI
ncbi:MAG: hypothetical protein A3I01_11985 [Betaproteobacteria bacterium RIFCSPLOWO2_02_FULL_65_24]|nr:MAG: hypothetical protein A3I01_11985 [Betaproteobacteria bacterium RIFCSPLOWO2_02_FULL_65_24]OGA97035.1 MAG: hypothetical protein A3G27_09670 [Betaproteobacteria bacterium RIFCSPLOWO2_12_FULL_66_14]